MKYFVCRVYHPPELAGERKDAIRLLEQMALDDMEYVRRIRRRHLARVWVVKPHSLRREVWIELKESDDSTSGPYCYSCMQAFLHAQELPVEPPIYPLPADSAEADDDYREEELDEE